MSVSIRAVSAQYQKKAGRSDLTEVNIIADGKKIKAFREMTLLDNLLCNGFDVPHLCHNKELEAYNIDLANRPQVIAANKIDALYDGENDDAITLLREEFEPEGIKVFPISAVSGRGVRELLYHVNNLLKELGEEKITFEREFFPEQVEENLPFTVFKSEEEEDVYHVEGPRVERMLGYTNLESEKGFDFFQKFMKDNGILDELEALGIQDGDTVKVFYHEFEYYK